MRKICLIGGSGFIGSSLINPLLASGREVHVVDIKQLKQKHPEVQFYKLNVQDAKELTALLSGMDELIYLAHEGTPALHNIDPEHEVKANVFFTVQLFRQLQKTALRKIIYFSSGGAIYGHTNELRLKETDITKPVSSYGIAKLSVEKYLQMFYSSLGLPIICVRPSNAYGPGQLPFQGQGFIATAIKLAQQKEPVTIFGKEGTIRDYLYIDDLVSATIGLLEKGKNGEIYNIGTGIGHSNMEVIRIIEQVSHKHHIKIALNEKPRRPFDVNYNVLDSTKLKETIRWEPKINLRTGIEETWDWLFNKFND